MSKSALFAGLGQGLMAAGQQIGEAYRMKAIEELRQENLQQNWAREDKIRAEDRSFQKDIQKENREYQQSQTESDRNWQAERDNQKFEREKDLLQDTRQYESSKTPVETIERTTESGEKVIEKFNANGEIVEVDRKELSKSEGQTTTHQHLVNMGFTPNTPEYKEAYATLSGLSEKAMASSNVKPKNVEQSKAEGFYDRMVNSQKEIDSLGDFDSTATWEKIRGLTNTTASPEFQRYKQAASDWIRSKLRKESGAVIGEEEMAAEYETYFPQFGDSQEVIEQKRRARKVAENAMFKSAGNMGGSYLNSNSQQGAQEDNTPRIGRFKVVGVN